MSHMTADWLRGLLEQVVVDPLLREEYFAWLKTLPTEWTVPGQVTEEEVDQIVREGLAGLEEEALRRLARSPDALALVSERVVGEEAGPLSDEPSAWDKAFERLGERLDERCPPEWRAKGVLDDFLMRNGKKE